MPAVAACLGATLVALAAQEPQRQPDAGVAEKRAVAYLAAEVPRWHREHSCYSCHNNGDATRALIAASSRGLPIGDSIDDTLAWLATPDRWASTARPGGGSEELPLGRIQFAGALASSIAAGRVKPDSLERAAELLAGDQQEDGAWRLSDTQNVGGATFYGTATATAMARRSLARASGSAAQLARARSAAWLGAADPAAVLDASSVILGLEGETDAAAAAQRVRALGVLKRGQAPDGGWGPYVTSQPEPFDTALAVLALSAVFPGDPEQQEMIRRGRVYLVETQSDDGSWPETTRPPNGESYAQRISTTAWALMALLASD